MNKEQLLKTAAQLQQVSEKAANEFTEKRESLVSLMNTRMEQRMDIIQIVGEDNLLMMKDNHANHARFLESIFINHVPEVLVDTILWVFRAYQSRGFDSTYWSAQLNSWLQIYKNELSKECYREISPYYHWMQINIPVFSQLAIEELSTGKSAH